LNKNTLKHFQKDLLLWYERHKRNLPWRNINNPYAIWVSEIILQQTTVDQGYDYYLRFLKNFPSVFDLANASEQDVLKLWQGLGYYSRARNMLYTAQIIVEHHDGNIPNDYDKLIKLKGIGPYTAAAILSFAFNKPYPVIDGNVMRVASRLFAIDEPINTSKGLKKIEEKVGLLYDKRFPADFNQAMMEFGALHCKVRNPECDMCFAHTYCMANRYKLHLLLPVKLKKQNIRQRYFNYFIPVFYKNNEPFTYLNKRGPNDIWQGLYDFLLFESTSQIKNQIIANNPLYKDFLKKNQITQADVQIMNITEVFSHKLTHQTINARFIIAKTPFFEAVADCVLVKLTEIDAFPLPKLLINFLNKLNIADHK